MKKRGRPMSITSNPGEWTDLSSAQVFGYPIWQSRKDYKVFTTDMEYYFSNDNPKEKRSIKTA